MDQDARGIQGACPCGHRNCVPVTSPGILPSLCQEQPPLQAAPWPVAEPWPPCSCTWPESLSSWKLPAHTMPVLRCG